MPHSIRDDRHRSLLYRVAPQVAASLVVLPLIACSKGPAAQVRSREEPALPVKVVAVKQETIQRVIDVVGTLAAEQEVTVSSEAEGTVSRVHADLGDRVRAGDVLVELDREKAQYSLDQQRAALARVLARYGGIEGEALPPIEQTADVQRAQAELAQARQAFDRAQELHKRQLIPRQTLDDADANLRAKQAIYRTSLQNGKDLRAQIDASRASAQLADRELRDTLIRAPFDGYVQKRLVNLGEFVKNQTPVMSVVRTDPLKVTAEIPEKMAPWVEAGQTTGVLVDAFPERPLEGKISRISPAVNPATRAFPFEALVPNHDPATPLKPGTFARVHIESGKGDQVLTIPYAAMQYRYGVNRAFVVDGDRLGARELKLGDRIGDRVEVVSGLKPGELVVTSTVETLVDGAKVTVK